MFLYSSLSQLSGRHVSFTTAGLHMAVNQPQKISFHRKKGASHSHTRKVDRIDETTKATELRDVTTTDVE
jgi:hypothetical protein